MRLPIDNQRPNGSGAVFPADPGVLHAILDSIGDGVIVADHTGKFILFNPAARRMIGMGATETTPDRWSDTYGAFLSDGVTPFPADQLPLARAIRGEATDDVEVVIRNASVPYGAVVSVTGRPLRDGDETLRGGVIVFRDVTQQKLADEHRRRTEAFLRSIVDHIPNMVFVKEASELRFVRFNKAGEALVGVTEHELLGKNDYDFFPPERVNPILG